MPFLVIFSSFFFSKKIPYVVTRDVCPSVVSSVRLFVVRRKILWNKVAL